MFDSSLLQSDISRLKALLGEGDVHARDLKTGTAQNRRASARVFSASNCGYTLFPAERFVYAGLPIEDRRKFLVLLCCVSVLTALAVLITHFVVLFAVPIVLYFIQIQLLEMKAAERQSNFDRDYAALLLSLSSGLKTGLDPLIALCKSVELFREDSVIRGELAAVERTLGEGKTEDEAIDAFGRTVRHPDVKLFRMAFKLARKEGASLSLCLQRLARVTRQRQSFRRKTRGAVAMQKLSAFGIALCTVMIGIIQGASNGQALVDAFANPMGRVLLIGGLSLVLTGIVWMLNMSKLRV
ncbi:MAG: type II secretion system F family protein [Bdellovibrionales bacterium]|nr:type II secretion system F family protein [Bdellovibrionales bacterium]